MDMFSFVRNGSQFFRLPLLFIVIIYFNQRFS